MILEEYLKELLKKGQGENKIYNIKLGANHASSFIFCGPVTPGIFAIIKQLSSEKVSELKKKKGKMSKLTLSNFTPLLTREIIETYDGISHDEPNTKIIIYEGSEKGDFWTIAEYNRYKEKKAKKAKEMKEKEIEEKEDYDDFVLPEIKYKKKNKIRKSEN